jgi:hypothetical protein
MVKKARDIDISDHATIRFIQRYQGIDIRPITARMNDHRALDWLRDNEGVDIQGLKKMIKAICKKRFVGCAGDGGYPIGNGCYAKFKGHVVVTIYFKDRKKHRRRRE